MLDSLTVLEAGGRAPRAVHLALWFHDAVHDGTAGDEEASADLARTLLSPLADSLEGRPDAATGAPAITAQEVDEVVRLVLVTRDHSPAAGDHAGALVSDADLAILASAPDRYARYVAQVRTEYSHVPDAAFVAGRMAVLEQLVTITPLFRTQTGFTRWEAAARANLRAELASLRESCPAS